MQSHSLLWQSGVPEYNRIQNNQIKSDVELSRSIVTDPNWSQTLIPGHSNVKGNEMALVCNHNKQSVWLRRIFEDKAHNWCFQKECQKEKNTVKHLLSFSSALYEIWRRALRRELWVMRRNSRYSNIVVVHRQLEGYKAYFLYATLIKLTITISNKTFNYPFIEKKNRIGSK